MKEVKFITLEANLVVNGIVNYNEVDKGKSLETKPNRAKKFQKGNSEVDYTSSNCLKHNLYKRYDQNSFYDAEYSDKKIWANLLGSELGLLRGLMNASEGLLRKSPVTVLSAQSTEAGLLVVEMGTSTKASVKEEIESENLIKSGGVKPINFKENTKSKTLFSFENAPERIQKFKSILRIQDLQFIPVGPRGSISEKDADLLLKALSNTYERLLGKTYKFEVKNYILKTQISPVPQLGVLLPIEMQKALVNLWLELCSDLHIFTSKGRLYLDAKTTKIGVNIHEATRSVDITNEVDFGELEQFYAEHK